MGIVITLAIGIALIIGYMGICVWNNKRILAKKLNTKVGYGDFVELQFSERNKNALRMKIFYNPVAINSLPN